MRVLVVEEEVQVAPLLCDGGWEGCCEVTPVASGAEALARLRESAVDLVVAVDAPPAVDGRALARELRDAGAAVPLLLLGRPDHDDAIVDAYDAGVTDYLSRPCSVTELLARVRALAGWRLPETVAEPAPEYAAGDPGRLATVEEAVLGLLQGVAYRTNGVIDLSRLQEGCQRLGYSRHEFSYGFVRLLSRDLIISCGDYVYCLSGAGQQAVRELPTHPESG